MQNCISLSASLRYNCCILPSASPRSSSAGRGFMCSSTWGLESKEGAQDGAGRTTFLSQCCLYVFCQRHREIRLKKALHAHPASPYCDGVKFCCLPFSKVNNSLLSVPVNSYNKLQVSWKQSKTLFSYSGDSSSTQVASLLNFLVQRSSASLVSPQGNSRT